jgi:hypothetical protein
MGGCCVARELCNRLRLGPSCGHASPFRVWSREGGRGWRVVGGVLTTRSSRVLLAILFGACAIRSSKSLPATVRETPEPNLASAECYAVSYTDGAGSAARLPFPTWLMLLPGADGGAAEGRLAGRSDDRGWAELWKYSGWKKIAGDSLEVMFTGSSEGIRIHVARSGADLSGKATWLTDVIGLPESSVMVTGKKEGCPQNVSVRSNEN